MYVSNIQMRLVNRKAPNPKCCSDPEFLCSNCLNTPRTQVSTDNAEYLPIPNTMEQIVNERKRDLTSQMSDRDYAQQKLIEQNYKKIGIVSDYGAPLVMPKLDWKKIRAAEQGRALDESRLR